MIATRPTRNSTGLLSRSIAAVLLAGATLVVGTQTAVAQADAPRPNGPPPRGMMADGPMGSPGAAMPNPRMLERMAGELGLTDAQRAKIKSAFEAARPASQKIREEMREAYKAMRALDAADPQYLTKANEAAKRIGELTTRMMVQGSQLRSTVWTTLTPEQRTKLAERMAKMRERMRERMDGRRGWGDRHGDRDRDRRGGGYGPRGPRGPDGPPPPPPPRG